MGLNQHSRKEPALPEVVWDISEMLQRPNRLDSPAACSVIFIWHLHERQKALEKVSDFDGHATSLFIKTTANISRRLFTPISTVMAQTQTIRPVVKVTYSMLAKIA